MSGKTRDLRVFGIAMAVVLGGIGTWQLVAGRSLAGTILAAVSGCFLVAAVLAPRLLLPLYIPWMKIGFALGYVMTRVVLTLFYFLVITPFGLARRLLGRDALDRDLDGDAETWWRDRDGEPRPPKRYERQF